MISLDLKYIQWLSSYIDFLWHIVERREQNGVGEQYYYGHYK